MKYIAIQYVEQVMVHSLSDPDYADWISGCS